MAGGRPREYDRIAVGKQFVEWVKDHPDCLTVPHFTTANNYDTTTLIAWAKEDEEFSKYYMQGKELIGINRLNATMASKDAGEKVLDKTIYLRHVGNFDADKRAFDREEKEFEITAKAKLETPPEHNVIYQTNYLNDSHPVQVPPQTISDNSSQQAE